MQKKWDIKDFKWFTISYCFKFKFMCPNRFVVPWQKKERVWRRFIKLPAMLPKIWVDQMLYIVYKMRYMYKYAEFKIIFGWFIFVKRNTCKNECTQYTCTCIVCIRKVAVWTRLTVNIQTFIEWSMQSDNMHLFTRIYQAQYVLLVVTYRRWYDLDFKWMKILFSFIQEQLGSVWLPAAYLGLGHHLNWKVMKWSWVLVSISWFISFTGYMQIILYICFFFKVRFSIS